MKKYFIVSLLVLGVILGGCNASNNSFKDYDLVMFTKVIPQPNSHESWLNMNTEIGECHTFTDVYPMQKQDAYGIAYYINQQNIPVTMSIKGKDINQSITILPLASKGFVWKNASYQTDNDNEEYIVALQCDGNELLSGYFTLASFNDSFDLSQECPYNTIRVYSNFVISEKNIFSTPIKITEEQPCGQAIYINKQDSPVTLSITGKNVDRTIEIAPFELGTLNWVNLDYDNQTYTVTIKNSEYHTLNGFLTLRRDVAI